MKTKKALLVMASLMATATLSTAIGLTAVSASTDTPVTPTTFTLDSGASVFTESSGNGLAYTLSMEKSNYENFMAEGYEDVTFGVLIAPEVYHVANPLNEENVFGANGATAVYDWATWNEDEGNWNEYTGTKTRIINIYAKALKESENAYTFRGAVTKLEGNSITGEYRGVGYVTYKDDNGATQYKVVTGDNVRTMHNVAEEAITAYQAAIDENKTLDGGTLDETTKTAYQTKISNLQTNYIAKANKINYTVTHHFVRADGTEYTQNDTVNAALNAPVTATPVTDNEYFTFDENNANNELTGKATSATVLDVYYTQNTKAVSDGAQLLDVDATTTLSVPAEVTGDILNVCIDGVSVNESIAESTVTLKNVGELATDGLTALSFVTDTGYCYTQEVDVYTLLNFTSESFMAKGTSILGAAVDTYSNPTKVSETYLGDYENEEKVYKISATGMEAFGAAMKPRHTQAYYTALNSAYGGSKVLLTFRYYIADDYGSWSNRPAKDLGAGSLGSNVTTGLPTDEWHTFVMQSGDFSAQSRVENMFGKYSYALAEKNLKNSGLTSTNGYLLRISSYKGGNRATSLYITEPTVSLVESFKLMDTQTTTSITASDLVNGKYPDYYISSLSIDGTVQTVESNTTLTNYMLPTLDEGEHSIVLGINNPIYISGQTNAYKEMTVFNGTVDVYNSANGVVLNYVDKDKIGSTVGLKKYTNSGFDSGLSVVEGTTLEEDSTISDTNYEYVGKYYKVSSTDMNGLWVKPIHSLAYYQMMKEKGYTGVSFDYYIKQVDKEIDKVCYNGTTIAADATAAKAHVDDWLTATATLDWIINNWTSIIDCTYSSTNGYEGYMFSVCEWNGGAVEFYVGNFRSAN